MKARNVRKHHVAQLIRYKGGNAKIFRWTWGGGGGGLGGLSLKEKMIGWHIKQRIDVVGLRKGSETADSRHMTRKLRKKTRILMSRGRLYKTLNHFFNHHFVVK